jgi:hypothetical protein
MEATIDNPTKTNRKAEVAARRKVTELKLASVDNRKQYAFSSGSDKSNQIAREAIKAGREEANKHYRESYGKSVFLKNIVTTLTHNHPDDVRFTLIDF